VEKVEKLLNAASQSQRDSLAKLLPEENFSKGKPASIEKLIYSIRWANDSSFWGQVVSDGKSYHQILQTVAKQLEINIPAAENTEEQIEQRICQKVLSGVLEKMNASQREMFIAAIQKESAKYGSDKSLLGVGGVAAALTAGKLGGFSTYILASSSLAAITGAAGLTLPFAAYTGLSAALGTALGPVGWIGLGLFALLSGGPQYDKLIPAILYISMLRNEPKTTS